MSKTFGQKVERQESLKKMPNTTKQNIGTSTWMSMLSDITHLQQQNNMCIRYIELELLWIGITAQGIGWECWISSVDFTDSKILLCDHHCKSWEHVQWEKWQSSGQCYCDQLVSVWAQLYKHPTQHRQIRSHHYWIHTLHCNWRLFELDFSGYWSLLWTRCHKIINVMKSSITCWKLPVYTFSCLPDESSQSRTVESFPPDKIYLLFFENWTECTLKLNH